MKKIFTLLFTVSSAALFAQKEIRHSDGSYYKQCRHFEISKPLSQLAKENPAVEKTGAPVEAKDAKRKFPWMANPNLNAGTNDPVLQKIQGSVSPEGTPANFDGTTSALGYDPLDPTGMVGPNHFAQCVNSNYQIFDKSGTALTGKINLSTLFPNSTDDGDPIVMYDKFADRWFISEFQAKPTNGNENELLIAISKTNDPTGSYYLYTFEPDPADFVDYPKFSIWADGYYETCNCDFQKVTIYDRTKMLAGDTSAGFIVVPTIAAPNGGGFFCPQTLFADGQLPPYGSPEYFFYYTDDNWGSQFKDMIYIYQITANWNSKSGTFTKFDSLATQPFNSYFTGGTEKDIAQPGTTTKLDALDGFFAYRIPYVRWGNYNSAVMCYPVNTGNLVAGIRWYELRQDTTTTKWSIYQQSTYAPADGVSRWNAGIGMDMNGNIGLAFSVSSSSSVYPGARYTGRNACDSLGTMTLAEGVAIAGTSSWTDNRWGDYSHTSLDPSDGITFWHTNQYIGASHSLKTRIFSFQIPVCNTSIATFSNSSQLLAWQSENNLHMKAIGLSSAENFEVGLYNLQGKLMSRKIISPFAGTLETSFSTFGMEKGIYFVRILQNNFQRTVKVSVQ